MNIKIRYLILVSLSLLVLTACAPPAVAPVKTVQQPTEAPVVKASPTIIPFQVTSQAFYATEICNASPIALGVLVENMNSNLRSVSLDFRFSSSLIGATEIQTIALLSDDQNRFVYTFPNDQGDFDIFQGQEGVLEYYFVVTDSAGNSVQHPTSSWAQISLQPCTESAKVQIKDTTAANSNDDSASARGENNPGKTSDQNSGNNPTGGYDTNIYTCDTCGITNGGNTGVITDPPVQLQPVDPDAPGTLVNPPGDVPTTCLFGC